MSGFADGFGRAALDAFATDPFALDMICHNEIVAKREEAGVKLNKNPRYSEYLRYAERLGLGIADPEKIKLITG